MVNFLNVAVCLCRGVPSLPGADTYPVLTPPFTSLLPPFNSLFYLYTIPTYHILFFINPPLPNPNIHPLTYLLTNSKIILPLKNKNKNSDSQLRLEIPKSDSRFSSQISQGQPEPCRPREPGA